MRREASPIKWLRASFPVDWDILRDLSSEPIPNHLKRWWYALGGTPLYLFVVLATTGITLTFYYRPSPDVAYDSIARITHEVRFGWFIRSVHHWAANLMVLSVLLHVLRVFFTRAYRKPRELNWMLGACLLLVVFTFGFTGYSLVYEQLSYWAAVVGTNIAEASPIIGPYVAWFLRGGDAISSNTLTRFFVIHIGVLPTVIVLLLTLHVIQIRLHGVSIPEGEDDAQRDKTFPFYPNHLYTEIIIGLVLTTLLTILALVAPAPLGEPADPNVTPEHIKPEWYFYPMFRWLKLTSFEAGVLGATAFVTIFVFWPFVDRILERLLPGKRAGFWLGVVGVLILLVFTVWEVLV